MFRALCAHHQEVKILLYSIWYHHNYRWPSRAQVERRLVKIVSYSIWYHHTCRWPFRAQFDLLMMST